MLKGFIMPVELTPSETNAVVEAKPQSAVNAAAEATESAPISEPCHQHGPGCDCGACAEAFGETPDELPDEELLYDLADLFKVFADTTRIKILYALMGSELAVNDIAALIGASQSAVSHQLRILKQAHLVKFRRVGKSVMYSLSDDHVYTMLAQGMSHICE